MDTFEKKSLQTKRGYTYTYYTLERNRLLPALLFLHGWPDHAQLWNGIIAGLTKQGNDFSIIVPDMLGYDGTSKPADSAEYNYEGVVNDVMDIVDAEKFTKVISTGHDWGSGVAQRIYNYYPERVEALIMLNVAYVPPSRDKLDIDGFNGMLQQLVGYPCFAYWTFFSDSGAPKLFKDNLEKVYHAIYAQDREIYLKLFCTKEGFHNYLKDTTPTEPYEVRAFARDPDFKRTFINRMQRDGFEGPQNWYRAVRYHHHLDHDSKLPPERSLVKIPTLFIGSTDDVVCIPELMDPAKQAGLLPDLEQTMIDSAHWSPYEKPNEVASIISDFLERKIPAKHKDRSIH